MTTVTEHINDKLKNGDFSSRKELVLWLAGDAGYQGRKHKHNAFLMLDALVGVWMEEKKVLVPLGIAQDILTGVESLEEVEVKYREIQYFLLRVENHMPKAVCEEALGRVLDWGVSGVALGMLIQRNSRQCKRTMLEAAELLQAKGEYLTTLLLLQYAIEHWAESESDGLEPADFLKIMQEMEKVM